MLAKILFYVLVIVLLCVAAGWFANGSGDMVLEWNNYELTTSTANFVFLLVIIIVVMVIVLPSVAGLFGLPKRWLKERENRKFRQGLDHVTQTMIAIASGNAAQASGHLKRANKVLAGQAIIPLLETQIAAATKDQTLLQTSLNQLQQHPETKALASKGLAEMHMRKGEMISAIPFAEQAIDLEPKNVDSFLITLTLYVENKQFSQAESLIEGGRKRKVINKSRYEALLAMVSYLRSMQARGEEAVSHIRTAYAHAPQAPHIYARYIELHNTPERMTDALNALKRSWEGCFSPLLYRLAGELKLEARDQKKLYQKLVGLSLKGKPYAYLLLAEMAMKRDDSKQAYGFLADAHGALGSRFDLEPPLKDELPEYAEQLAEAYAQATVQLETAHWACHTCGQSVEAWQAVCGSCQGLNSIGIRP